MSTREAALAEDPVAYWNGRAGERWTREQARLDLTLRPFGIEALRAAAVKAGERVIDVGCGCGDTTIALAERVGATGSVVGVDVSAPMLARARERSGSIPNVRYVEADATALDPETRADILFSRFGVMFFPEPERSFEALSRTLTSTGRVAFVCWRALAENPWMRAPYESVRATIGAPAQPPSEAPGPFAFARPERVRAILEGAGFVDVAAKAFDHDVIIGATIDDAVEFASTNGPAAILLATIEDAPARARAIAAIRAMLVAQAKGNGPLRMPGATWIVTARKARD